MKAAAEIFRRCLFVWDMADCWILVGMMGAGKSTVGRRLAELANRAFYDTDAMIEQRLGRSIPSLFKHYGIDAFRDHETAILRSCSLDSAVLSTGGGIVLRPQNWVEMRRLGKVVFLHVPIEELTRRLHKSKRVRPLLREPDWEVKLASLYAEREALYRQADVTIEVLEDLEATAQAVLKELQG